MAEKVLYEGEHIIVGKDDEGYYVDCFHKNVGDGVFSGATAEEMIVFLAKCVEEAYKKK